MKRTLFLTVFVLFFALLADVPAQQGGGRRGGGGRRLRPDATAPAPPAAAAATPDAAAQPAEAGIGEVPKLVSPSGSVSSLQVVEVSETQSIVPNLPYKALRYATAVFDKYDLDKSGFLEREEWLKMPGKPQTIDLDGDFVISLEEFLRFIALYGNPRTIHRPNPPQAAVRAAVDPASLRVFRPLSAPFPAPQPEQSPESATEQQNAETEKLNENQIIGESENGEESDESQPETDAEQTEEEGEEEKIDDLTYEKVFEGKFKPSERKYHVPLSELRGVPNWFVLRDKDGDGQLSMIEYDPTLSPAGLANFGRMDKNGDGFLSAAEVREALRAGRKQ